jgi:hypothetical protein
MKTFDLYGFTEDGLDDLIIPIQEVLGVKFIAATGDYVGDHYYHWTELEEKFDLRTNIDGEGEWSQKKYKEMGALLYVSNTERADELKELLTSKVPGIVFLDREVFPD